MKAVSWIIIVLAIAAGLFLFFRKAEGPAGMPASLPRIMKISSSAFAHHQNIPAKYTCDGENISPPLLFSDVPENARSLALIMDDPDAPNGTWDHWLVWDIAPGTREIKENAIPFGKESSLPIGTVVGRNSWSQNEYGGPCPPDREHRYFFKLYALDSMLDLPEGATKTEVEQAMAGHILAQAELVGLYQRIGR